MCASVTHRPRPRFYNGAHDPSPELKGASDPAGRIGCALLALGSDRVRPYRTGVAAYAPLLHRGIERFAARRHWEGECRKRVGESYGYSV